MNYNHIINYLHYKNGDVHVSRGFVRTIMEKLRTINPAMQFTFSHQNSPNILADIPGLQYDNSIWRQLSQETPDHDFGNGTLGLNCWYGVQHFGYIRRYGITFECLYRIFDDTCKRRFGFSLADISNDPRDFLPAIDFNYFKIDAVDEFFKNNQNKVVLVCNGHAQSGQANNFNMTGIVQALANKYAGIVFILTNIENSKINQHNIFYSEDIIKKGGFDLNENSYIGSKYANVIIGRASGAYSFCYTRENLCERNNLKFVSFSDGTASKWAGPNFSQQGLFTTPIVESGAADYNSVFSLIDRNIV